MVKIIKLKVIFGLVKQIGKKYLLMFLILIIKIADKFFRTHKGRIKGCPKASVG